MIAVSQRRDRESRGSFGFGGNHAPHAAPRSSFSYLLIITHSYVNLPPFQEHPLPPISSSWLPTHTSVWNYGESPEAEKESESEVWYWWYSLKCWSLGFKARTLNMLCSWCILVIIPWYAPRRFLLSLIGLIGPRCRVHGILTLG